jgi:hypothetical protein
VEEHYARLFARDDFNVSAIVWLSAEQSSVEKILMDPDLSFTRPIQSRFEREEGVEPGANEGGLLAPPAPGVRRVVRETTEEKAFVSQSKTITNIPPGIVQGVSLTVLFDLEAVETVIARDARAGSRHSRTGADPAGLSHALWQAPERSLAVLAFVAKEEEALRTLLRHPVGDAQVKVLVHPFAKSPAGEARDLPAPDIAAAGPPPAARTGAAGWILAALLAAAAIAGAALVLRRSVPDDASASNREPEGGWKALRREHAPGAGSLGEDVLRTVTRTNGAVRENPEAAAYVLRFWLSQDAAESLGGQTRS